MLHAEKGVVFIICGPSGSGKNTLADYLLQHNENLVYSVSYTTRDKRELEENGKDYYFVSMEEFTAMENRGDFLESCLVHGNKYGTSKKQIKDILDSGKNVLIILDVVGTAKLQQLLEGSAYSTYSVFIAPESKEILVERLNKRGDSHDIISKRMENARGEILSFSICDSVIVNKDLYRAYEDIQKIYDVARTQSSLYRNCIKDIVLNW